MSLATAARAARLTASGIDVALLGLAIAAVLAIRVQLLLATDFPINDGALFLAFVDAIARVFPHIPAFVEYNGWSLPLAYPPIGFWLSAAAVRAGASPLGVVHVLPILINMGYVLLYALLLLRTGHSRLFTALAVFVFGTTFRSYEWLVMGGGLSRGFGSIFLLLTLLSLLQEKRAPSVSPARLVAGGVCVGAAVGSHLEWGILSALSAVVCLALTWPGWTDFIRRSLVVGVTAALVVAPWFLHVYAQHGLEPFAAAAGSGQWSSHVFLGSVKNIVRSSNFLLPFVLIGIVSAVRTRELFWVVFMMAALLLIPRTGETPMVLSLGVLAASGFLTCFVLLRERVGANARAALMAFALLGAVLCALRTTDAMRRDENFAVLSPEVRAAMAWVAQSHAGERFAVIKEASWQYNATAEWFPVLAHAINVTTTQGSEWLRGKFGPLSRANEDLNIATSCEQVRASLGEFEPARFVWVEGLDLQARGRAIAAGRAHRSLGDWMAALGRSVRGESGYDRGGGVSALHGPGTLAGCFETQGYDPVYSNARVRIFQRRAT